MIANSLLGGDWDSVGNLKAREWKQFGGLEKWARGLTRWHVGYPVPVCSDATEDSRCFLMRCSFL